MGKLKLNDGIRPPGGFKFTEVDGVKFEADDLRRLVSAIGAYRVNTGKPPGDPEQEYLRKLCARIPMICTELGEPPVDMKALSVYVSHHIHKAFMESGQHLRHTCDELTVLARMVTCSGCSHCVDWSKGCAPCQQGAELGIQKAIEPKRVIPGTEKLACAIGKDSLAISLWDLNPRPIPGAPAECWRKEPSA